MPQFTHKNHLKFGWGDGVYNFNDKDQQLWVDFGQAEYIPTSFKDECVRSARLIGKAADKPILLFLSGGIDSEVAARSFLEANIPFEVATTNIIHNGKIINEHDTIYATSFIKKFNLKAHTININFIDLANRYNHIRDTNNPEEPYYKITMGSLLRIMMLEQFCENYFCITGNGDVVISTHRSYNQAGAIQYGLYVGRSFSCSALSADELSSRKSINAARFFCYTPEILLAWILDPDIQHWIKYEKALMGPHGWMNIHTIKSFVLYKIWPEMEIRPKLIGFENIPKYTDLYPNDFYNDDKSYVKIPIETLLNMLLPKESTT
jgi:hypothetical protein